MFSAALFVITKIQNDQNVHQQGTDIHMIEYYEAVQRNRTIRSIYAINNDFQKDTIIDQ